MRTIEQILSQVPDKREDKDTTSHEFKKIYMIFLGKINGENAL